MQDLLYGIHGFPLNPGCVSVDNAVVYGIPGEGVLKNGQIVGIDCGAELEGYFGDHAKSFPVGEIDGNKKKLLDVTKESLAKAIDKARVGNYVGDIGFAVQKHAEENGFSVVRELVDMELDLNCGMRSHKYLILISCQGYQLTSGVYSD